MKTYFLWTIQAYKNQDEAGNLKDVSVVSVVAKTEADAHARAKKILVRDNYRTASVVEYKEDAK